MAWCLILQNAFCLNFSLNMSVGEGKDLARKGTTDAQTQKWEQRMEGTNTGSANSVHQIMHLFSQLCWVKPAPDVLMETRTAAKTYALSCDFCWQDWNSTKVWLTKTQIGLLFLSKCTPTWLLMNGLNGPHLRLIRVKRMAHSFFLYSRYVSTVAPQAPGTLGYITGSGSGDYSIVRPYIPFLTERKPLALSVCDHGQDFWKLGHNEGVLSTVKQLKNLNHLKPGRRTMKRIKLAESHTRLHHQTSKRVFCVWQSNTTTIVNTFNTSARFGPNVL